MATFHSFLYVYQRVHNLKKHVFNGVEHELNNTFVCV
jgi:hypothetical protein